MAKIDLHRHLGGSISPETIWEIIKAQPKLQNLADSLRSVEEDMTYRYEKDSKNLTFHKFLKKFNILNYIRWKEDNIDLIIKNAVKDMADEGLKYCELRFSITKYLNNLPWDETEATLFVLDRIKHWSKKYDVRIGPVLCLKYETAKVYSKRISKLIHHWKVAEDVAGIDFVGAESHFERRFLMDCFRHWRLCGKGLLIHAGETQSAENVRIAIEDLGVDRVSHGIQAAMHDQTVLNIAKEKGTIFDVAISSNFYTGAVKGGMEEVPYHPVVKMIMKGCKITIGTDDPAIFDITLDQEYQRLEKILEVHSELSKEEIKGTIREIKENSWLYGIKSKDIDFEDWDHNRDVYSMLSQNQKNNLRNSGDIIKRDEGEFTL